MTTGRAPDRTRTDVGPVGRVVCPSSLDGSSVRDVNTLIPEAHVAKTKVIGCRVPDPLYDGARRALGLPDDVPPSDVIRRALARVADLDVDEHTPRLGGSRPGAGGRRPGAGRPRKIRAEGAVN